MTDVSTTPVPVAEHLADLVVEFPLHSEWTNASGDRRTIVGYPRRGDLLLVEACAGQAPVRVPIEDVRREYTRVGAATPCPIVEAVTLRRSFSGYDNWAPKNLGPAITLHPPGLAPAHEPGQYGIYTWGGGA